MRSIRLICLLASLLGTMMLARSTPVSLSRDLAPKSAPATGLSQPNPANQAKIAASYGKLPLSFEANHGQTDSRVKFMSRTSGYTLYLTGDEAVLALSGKKHSTRGSTDRSSALQRGVATDSKDVGVLRMKLHNANPAAKVTGTDELAGASNYFIGNDPTKWRTNVPTYAKVRYEGIYSGIDLVYYGNQRQLEYDFIVAPGADPRRIAFDVGGAKRIRRDAQGDLVFKVGDDEVRWHKPVVYQEKDGARQLVAANYAITSTNRVGFELAKYDASRPLYVDPLIYSTYLGGSSDDLGTGIAVDSAGDAYVIGTTYSVDFPTASGSFQTACNGGSACWAYGDVFVSKINPSGSELVYSTYLGGSTNDYGEAIVVDNSGNAYITGWTNSADFPTVNPLQSVFGGDDDAFVAKLNPTGSALVYSTYLGGSGDEDRSVGFDGNGFGGIAVDTLGNAYVTGWTNSADFPTVNPLQPVFGGGLGDVFVSKINPSGSELVYSTYLGGGGNDRGNGIAVDTSGSAYVTGWTDSTNFPTMNPLQSAYGGDDDVFVAKLNPTGSALVYSTYLGGSGSGGDVGYGIAVDSAGNAYVAGVTYSSDFPTKNPFQKALAGVSNAFVSKFNASGSALLYSTYLGGGGIDYGRSIAVDNSGNVYIAGETASTDFPTTPGAIPLCHLPCGLWHAFVARLNFPGSALVYSTYLGGRKGDYGYGIAVNSSGNAYVTGLTQSGNFPTTEPLQPANAGGQDAFVAKMDVRALPAVTLSSSPSPSTYGQIATFTAAITSSPGTPPDGEAISFLKGKTLLGTAFLKSGSASFSTPALAVAANSITATYSGDSNFLGSTSKAVKQVVTKATTTTALASSQNPSNAKQSVAFTANVTPQFSGTVTGTATFYDGATKLGAASLKGGFAKFATSKLASGGHSITATYNGSTSFTGSSASLTQTVN